MLSRDIIHENNKSALRFDAFADGHDGKGNRPRDNLVIHDKEGNFNGQVESAPGGGEKYFDCPGNFAGQSTRAGTFDAHGNRIGWSLIFTK